MVNQLKVARTKRATMVRAFEAACTKLRETCEADDGSTATAKLLRLIAEVEKFMDKLEDAHVEVAVLVDEGQEAHEAAYISDMYAQADTAKEAAHTIIEARAAAPPGDGVPAAPSARSQRAAEASALTDEHRLVLALGSRDALIDRIDQGLAGVETRIVRGFTDLESLRLQEELLGQVTELAEQVSRLTLPLTELKPEQAEVFMALASNKQIEVGARVIEARNTLAATRASLAPRQEVRPAAPTGQFQQFEKAALPDFSGQRRDYAGFRRDWKASVEGKLEAPAEVRQFKTRVPVEVRNDLKNFLTMAECWTCLNDRYADPMISVAEYVGQLDRFAYSSPRLTDAAKFKELSAAWLQAINDMTELDAVEQLGQSTILAKLVQKLPNTVQQERYVSQRILKREENAKCRAARQAEPHTELSIMREFMQEEKKMMEHMALLTPAKEQSSAATGPVAESRRPDRRRSPERRRDRSGCHHCGGRHRAADCQQRRGVNSNKGSAGKVNANMQVKPKPCPACKDQHTFKGTDGTLLYRNRLAGCLAFQNLSVVARAQMIETAGGCALCLDWTGAHTRDTCKETIKGKLYKACGEMVGNSACGRKHHRLLHGAATKYVNWIQLNSVSRPGPTSEDLEQGDRVTTLLPIQQLTVEGEVDTGTAFFDSGSNINLVTFDMARRAGWVGRPVKLHMQTTGRPAECWDTVAYWVPLVDTAGDTHLVLAFGMDVITAPLGPVDIGHVYELFEGITYEQVRRPEGPVDLLIGIHEAGLFPCIADRSKHRRGNLRLLTSLFGTGYLLDGTYPSVKAGQLLQSPESHVVSRARAVGPNSIMANSPSERRRERLYSQPRLSHRSNKLAAFSFPECEEMAVGQPRRCESCSSCRKCSDGQQQTTRREQMELRLIERGMALDPVRHEVTFHYPLLRDPACLSDNRGQAIAIACGLERRLVRNKQLEAYNTEMRAFVERGVFKELSQEEMGAWAGPVNYISHLGVHKDGATTKLRIVANSSLNNNNLGVSYNDLQAKGPNSLVALIDAILRWRAGEHTVVWDLTKAYNTVKTFVEELHMRRLVWRWGEATEDWTTYGIDRMHFGDRCAMAGLERARYLTAEAGRDIDPEAADMIQNGYVDDMVGGGAEETIDRLIGDEVWESEKPRYDGTVSRILAKGGFKIKVMVRDGERRAEVINLLGSGVLGLAWSPGADTITMHLAVNLSQKAASGSRGSELTQETIEEIESILITRRLIVSAVYSVYDPVGLIAPITIRYKLVLQKLSHSNDGWDDELEPELAAEAREIMKQMVLAEDIVFPRSTKPPGTTGPCELVGWWDGGDPASAACLYTRYKLVRAKANGETHVLRLQMAKARVTPTAKGPELPRKSTPRSELRGLLLLARIVTVSCAALKADPPSRISLFGDSECTISSVECLDGILKAWFGNRVAEINECMEAWEAAGITVDKLHHWPGLRNIADIATKGKAELVDVQPGSEWQDGPTEARFPRSTWPASRDFRRQLPAEETAAPYAANAAGKPVFTEIKVFQIVEEIMQRFNELNKVKATVARWLLAAASRTRADAELGPSVNSLDSAYSLMYLASGQQVDTAVKSGVLAGLSPVWRHGRWETRGRLGNGMFAVLGVDALPILLPHQRLSYLIMLEAHRQDHRGSSVTLWRSRTRAWIVRGRRLADEVEKACILCRGMKARLEAQRMGQLPEERIAVGTKPFHAICLDFLGPTVVKAMVNKRAEMKVWPLLIVCQATGALHTELCYDYSTLAFLNAWQHFISVRGVPRLVVSDQGSQLTSARNKVAFSSKTGPGAWDWEEIQEKGARAGTKWTFVPPGAQFRNGLAESRVKSIKHTMDHMLSTAIQGVKPTLNYAQMETLLAEAANVVNDRPVGARLLTETDFTAITVNMLLHGRTSTTEPGTLEGEVEEGDARTLNAYQENLLDTWWRLWKEQGFPHLLPFYRHKDAKRHRNLRQGDVCLVMYDNQVKNTYRLCRVLEAIVSEHDGVVRTVTIGFQKRRTVTSRRLTYRALDEMTVAIQRLVLIVPAEELPEAETINETLKGAAEVPDKQSKGAGEPGESGEHEKPEAGAEVAGEQPGAGAERAAVANTLLADAGEPGEDDHIFTCSLCGEEFYTQVGLWRHVEREHEPRSDHNNNPEDVSAESEGFACGIQTVEEVWGAASFAIYGGAGVHAQESVGGEGEMSDSANPTNEDCLGDEGGARGAIEACQVCGGCAHITITKTTNVETVETTEVITTTETREYAA